jgi:hypothetical protein
MARNAASQISAEHVSRRRPPRWLQRRRRIRLAQAVRRHALAERERRYRHGVVEFESIDARTALYERIAGHLEALELPVGEAGMRRLRRLLAEKPRGRDYLTRAEARDARLALILADLQES